MNVTAHPPLQALPGAIRRLIARIGPGPLLAAGLFPHVVAIGLFGWLTFHRIGYPLELGWVEGILMDSIRRLASLQPVYPAPTLDYIPLAYMPGYYLAVAPFVEILGLHLWVPRAVSLAQTLLAAYLIARAVRRETGQDALALAGAGLFFGAFGFCGGSYDHVQPNSQLVLFALAGATTLRESRGASAAALAGAWFGLAFLTKQHGLLMGLAMLPYLLLLDRRRLLPYLFSLAVFAGGGYLLLKSAFGPWFVFYTWDVPAHWSTFDLIKTENFGRYVVGVFGVCTTLIALGALPAAWRDEDDRRGWVWWWCAAGGFAAGLLATLDPYSYRHTLTPMVATFALVAPIAAWRVVRAVQGDRATATLATGIVLWLLAPQYVPIVYSVHDHLPRHGAAPLREAFYERLRAVPQRVLMVNHGYYLPDAGRRPSFHMLALEDILRSNGNALLRRDPTYFDRQLSALLEGPDRPWILTDRPIEELGDRSNPWWRRIAGGYAVRDSFPEIVQVELPLTGLNEAPHYLYAPTERGAP